MGKGLDIKILGITVGHHFNMISEHVKDKGNLDWSLLVNNGTQTVTRQVWGHTYEVVFSYCPYDEILIAECVR